MADDQRRRTWRGCLEDDSGAISFAEYALILAVVGTAIALVALSLASDVSRVLNDQANQWAENTTINTSHPAGVRTGGGAFIRPSPMRVGSWYPIEFVAGPNPAALSEEAEKLPSYGGSPDICQQDHARDSSA